MAQSSAGLLMYRIRDGELQLLLAHPGGPFWRNRDAGAWTIPKGVINASEDPLAAAIREFQEETGLTATPEYIALGSIRMKSGKIVHAWAFEGDCDPSQIQSNTFALEWPPRSKQYIQCPEIDRAGFFSIDEARTKILPAQLELLDRLQSSIHSSGR